MVSFRVGICHGEVVEHMMNVGHICCIAVRLISECRNYSADVQVHIQVQVEL